MKNSVSDCIYECGESSFFDKITVLEFWWWLYGGLGSFSVLNINTEECFYIMCKIDDKFYGVKRKKTRNGNYRIVSGKLERVYGANQNVWKIVKF